LASGCGRSCLGIRRRGGGGLGRLVGGWREEGRVGKKRRVCIRVHVHLFFPFFLEYDCSINTIDSFFLLTSSLLPSPPLLPQTPRPPRPRDPPQARQRPILPLLLLLHFCLTPSLPPSLLRHQDPRRPRARTTHLVLTHACPESCLRSGNGCKGRGLRIARVDKERGREGGRGVKHMPALTAIYVQEMDARAEAYALLGSCA